MNELSLKSIGLKVFGVISILFLLFLPFTMAGNNNLNDELHKDLVIEFIEQQVNDGYVESHVDNSSLFNGVTEGYMLNVFEIDEFFVEVNYANFDNGLVLITMSFIDGLWYLEEVFVDGTSYAIYNDVGYEIDIEVLKRGLKGIVSEDLEFLEDVYEEEA